MHNIRTACLVSAALMLLAKVGAPAQEPPKGKAAGSKTIVSVKGEGERALELTAEEFAKLPRQSVHAKDHVDG